MSYRVASAGLLIALAGTGFCQSSEGDVRATETAAFFFALGRGPEPAERAPDAIAVSLGERMTALKNGLASNPAERARVAERACRDAFGRAACGDELTTAPTSVSTYTELMRRHHRRLTADPSAYEQVIQRAYQLVVSREAYAEEVAYWRKAGTLPFVLLVGCLDNWARRNQPGLMVTGGQPTITRQSPYVCTVRLEPETAMQARREVALDASAPAAGDVLAIGGDGLLTNGRLSFAVVGAERLLGSEPR